MKTVESSPRVFVLAVLLLCLSQFLPIPQWLLNLQNPPPPKDALQVLFIGNSFTSGNNLPQMVEDMSLMTKQPIATKMVAPGGVYLQWHLHSSETNAVLRSKRWDVVVLQDCSTCPLDNADYFESGVREMVALVRTLKARPILFMTWADEGKDDDQKIISAAYDKMTASLHIEAAPVGRAWNRAAKELPALSLYSPDHHHAGSLGTLLTADVFLQMLAPEAELPLAVHIPPQPRFLYELWYSRPALVADKSTANVLRDIARESLQ